MAGCVFLWRRIGFYATSPSGRICIQTGYAGGIDKKIALLELEQTDMSHLFIPKKGTAL